MLFDDLFYGEGDTLVVKQDGTIIAQEEGDSQQKRKFRMEEIYLIIMKRKIEIKHRH